MTQKGISSIIIILIIVGLLGLAGGVRSRLLYHPINIYPDINNYQDIQD